ncbi:hypothetical protein C8J57DRAFT_1528033 [Mycena rebaudengoi]|nr:hypothetical protein C8J57DRAFT_1528033 [Mycena rebaudengoi]
MHSFLHVFDLPLVLLTDLALLSRFFPVARAASPRRRRPEHLPLVRDTRHTRHLPLHDDVPQSRHDVMTVVRPPAAPLAPVVLPNRYAQPLHRGRRPLRERAERGVRVSRLLSPYDSIRGRRVGMRPSVARALATLPR